MRRLPVLTAAAWALAACQAPPAGTSGPGRFVQSVRIDTRTVDPDRTARLYTFVHYRGHTCDPNPNFTVAVVTPPTHGQVETGPGTIAPAEHTTIETLHCTEPAPGVAVRYRPDPGYHGPDALVVSDGDSRVTFNVTVR